MSQISIRHVSIDDAHALQQLYSQPDTQANTLQVPFPSLKHWQDRLTDLRPGVHSLVACIEGQVVGQITLEINSSPRRRHTATFGMGVDVNHRGKGVAQALLAAIIDLCDNWLAIERIELTVFTDNAAAIAVYRKFGFEVEGTGRQYGLRNGEKIDAFYMARMRD
ncbi:MULTISPECIES: GNAT family N-acetyltransferase [Winslowiella]|uniref:GNAT family N-acetyltransferase n=1 Tax=Winslowiella TaxID=2997349 RepID=UPI0028BD60E0|nr:GNAT family N-acetyltransferase [Winslowiella toletana]WNN44604.1 GNAT family N-acetyltransferase [Winslowiella toletana]